MAQPAADYHRGDMEITEQKSTFHAFTAAAKWICLIVAAAMVFLVLDFCTAANFIQAAIAAVVVLVLGVLLLREKKTSGH